MSLKVFVTENRVKHYWNTKNYTSSIKFLCGKEGDAYEMSHLYPENARYRCIECESVIRDKVQEDPGERVDYGD